jgi:hypothetical protein
MLWCAVLCRSRCLSVAAPSVTVPYLLYVAVTLLSGCRYLCLLYLRIIGRGRDEIRLRGLTDLHSTTHHQSQAYINYTLFNVIITFTIHSIIFLHIVLRANHHKLTDFTLYWHWGDAHRLLTYEILKCTY